MEGRAAALTVFGVLIAAAPLAAQRSPVALQADAAASRIYVITHRTGLLSFLGHEHVILVQEFNASVCWDEEGHDASTALLVVDALSLDIDADSARALAGLGKGPSAQQRAQIHSKLHAEKGLDTQHFPELRFQSVRVIAEDRGKLRVRGVLTIKGNAREIELPVTVQRRANDELWLSGQVRFRQSSFGIKPESIAGVVKVSDEVDLHVGLLLRRTTRACAD